MVKFNCHDLNDKVEGQKWTSLYKLFSHAFLMNFARFAQKQNIFYRIWEILTGSSEQNRV